MSHIKTAMEDVRASVGSDAFHELARRDLDNGVAAAMRSRADIADAYGNLREAGPRIQHRALRDILMRLHGIQPDGTAAFNARLKHLLDQGLIADQRPEGRRRRVYRLVDVLEIALCLQLQRSYVPPATAVRFVIDNRVRLDQFWSERPSDIAPRLFIEVDAFAAIGAKGREMGRGSRGNETGTISLSRLGHLNAEAIPPSTLVIDTFDLQRRVHDQLARESVRAAVSDRYRPPSS